MKRIFVDTSAWYAFVDRQDPDHPDAADFYNDVTVPFLTTNFIFDETATLIMNRLGWEAAVRFGEQLKISRFVSLAALTDADEDRGWRIFKKYKNTGFSYTDCTSFAIMERLGIDTAFAFDEHFKIMNFHLVPESRKTR